MDINWKWIRLKVGFNVPNADKSMYASNPGQIFKFRDTPSIDKETLFVFYENCKICEKKDYLKNCMGHASHLYWAFVKINESVFEDITLSKIRDIKIESILKD
jgi:hypothetical protein